MKYDYKCRECEHEWDRYLPMDDRKIPESEPCPSCGAEGSVYQVIGCPGFISDSKSTLTRAGSGWQDVLKGIKKASGKSNTIND